MSLPGSAIEQLRDELQKSGVSVEDALTYKELIFTIEKQADLIKFLEIENATLRRRVESLEGVTT